MANVEKLESFTVHCSSILNVEELNVLTLLYNPLLKSDAYNVYLLLSSLVDRSSLKSFTSKHQFLFDLTLLDSERFYNARIKLEAIGLLTTLYSDNSYIYILKSPYTAKEFLVDGILGTFLRSEIGESNFKQLFKLFNINKISKENYSNITKNFDDVFTTEIEMKEVEKTDFILGKNLNTGVKIDSFSFNYDKFIDNVKALMDNTKKKSKKLETRLTNIAYAYGFDESSLANIYRQSIDSSGNLDYVLLNQNAVDEFSFQYGKGLPKIASKSVDQFYNTLYNSTAESILKQYSKFKKALPDDLEKISKIYNEFENLDRAVINLSILKVLAIKDGDVPAFAYFKKVLVDLIEKGLTDFDNAKKYYFGEVKPSELKTSTPKKSINKNPKNPKWLNEALDNIMDGVETL